MSGQGEDLECFGFSQSVQGRYDGGMKLHFFILIFFVSCAQVSTPTQLSSTQVRIASVNFKVKGEQTLTKHFEKIEAWVVLAKKHQASFLLLPELMILDLLPKEPKKEEMQMHLEALANQAEVYEKFLSSMGKRHQVSILGASVVIKEKSYFINRAFYVNAIGEVAYQDKVRPTPWEVANGFIGSKKIKLFEQDKITFSILICHDAEFPTISSDLSKLHPEIILCPLKRMICMD